MEFRKKPVVVEAIDFHELIDYGIMHGANIVNGYPWSFEYKGHPISHESNTCYLIPTLEGIMRFTEGDMLITGVNGEIYPCKIDIFEKTYEPAIKHEVQRTINCLDACYRGNEDIDFTGYTRQDAWAAFEFAIQALRRIDMPEVDLMSKFKRNLKAYDELQDKFDKLYADYADLTDRYSAIGGSPK